MNNKTIDFELIKKQLIPYFVKIYGEEYEELIISKMSKIVPVFYTTAGAQYSELLHQKALKRMELTIKLLEANNINIPDEIKKEVLVNTSTHYLRKIPEAMDFLEKHLGYNAYSESLTTSVNNILQEPSNNNYLIKKSIEILKRFGVAVSESEYNEWILSDEAKELFNKNDRICQMIRKLDVEYKEFDQQFNSLEDIINKSTKITSAISQKYMLEFLKSISDYMSKDDQNRLAEYLVQNNKSFYSLQHEMEISKIVGEYIAYDGPIASFSSKAADILLDSKTSQYQKKNIIDERIAYYKAIGLYHDQMPPEEFLLSEEAIAHTPSREFVDQLQAKKAHYNKLCNEEIIIATSTYTMNMEQIQQLDLITRSEFGVDTILSKIICISPQARIVDGQPEAVALLIFPPDMALNSFRDILFIHEINHAIETTLTDVTKDDCIFQCGFETVDENDKIPRKYEAFSEVINQLIAMEVTEELHNDGITLFDDIKTSCVKGSSSYEHQRYLVEGFFNTFKKEIIATRTSKSLDRLFEIVGQENFERLNEIVSEYSSLPYYQMMDDVINKRTTELTIKRESLVKNSREVLSYMIEHAKTIPGYENLESRKK